MVLGGGTRGMAIEIRRHQDFEHPLERVWQALTDPSKAANWLGWTDLRAKPGTKFSILAAANEHWDGIIRCKVLEVDPPNRFVYSWQLTADDVHQVEWTLKPKGSGTRLMVVHRGFASDWALRAMVTEGYRVLVEEGLPRYLATGEPQLPAYQPTPAQLGNPS